MGLKEKKFSAVELVDAYLARINTFDKELNSFITVSDEHAYREAGDVDKSIKELGKEAFLKYPLLGVCVAHKDVFLTKSIRTTAASKVLENYIPAYSATVVKKMADAGSITLGKTNCDAWAHGSSGENSDFGPSKNPWDKEYVPGGSSSGSGVALAANFALIATGTDTCGSVRLPANYCCLFGLKPTYGSVSRYGVVAMASSLDSIGHLARSTEDIEKVFLVTKGLDQKDSTLAERNFQISKTKLRLGIAKEFFTEGLDEEVKNSVLASANFFEKNGFEVKEVSMPYTKYGISVYYIVQPAEVSSNLGRYDGIRYGGERKRFADEAKRRIMLGTYVLSSGYYDAYYLKAMKVRSKIIEDVQKVFENVDVLIAPVTPTPPFKLGEKVNNPLKMYLTDIFAATANLSGIPSLAIPCGFTKTGLPLGFQLMGPKFSEPLLFKLGKLYEDWTNWKPKVASLST
ncbi:MAG: Glutamyl-tRNA(Gln) amidotransferase subunit A [Candidatus Woesebacteria bacterium GW2011_GWB1_38_5b]|nr:MAG: Glutamyl-tRNA(Gln) amidotransferase subunit A [Candidatus Woesebacteria bacterium GW2011_GWB1_38_5b]